MENTQGRWTTLSTGKDVELLGLLCIAGGNENGTLGNLYFSMKLTFFFKSHSAVSNGKLINTGLRDKNFYYSPTKMLRGRQSKIRPIFQECHP